MNLDQPCNRAPTGCARRIPENTDGQHRKAGASIARQGAIGGPAICRTLLFTVATAAFMVSRESCYGYRPQFPKHAGANWKRTYQVTEDMALTSDSSPRVHAEASATVQKRLALVIGINEYEKVEKLKKAINDADRMKSALVDLGFEVHHEVDLRYTAMVHALTSFCCRIDKGDIVFFFFAGHGVEIKGENFLLPADVPKPAEGQDWTIRELALSAAAVIERFQEREAKLVVAVLDACRDNPFARAGGRSLNASRGLADMSQCPEGTFILFSAAAKQKALDGLSDDDSNPNSVFTRVFAPLLKERAFSLVSLVKTVQAKVRSLAMTIGYPQHPAYYDGVVDEVYLAGAPSQVQTQWFQDLDGAPKMVVIPPGNMTCGARIGERELGALPHEYPQHEVQIAKPFALSRSPVTALEWQAYALERGLERPTGPNNAPIVKVSWYEAKAYTEWLTEKTGHRYRLPTEAEWEYAARAGRPGTLYAWGDMITRERAHYGRTQGSASQVEQLEPNDYGLYDMHGNVWEWVADSYVDTYSSNPSDGSAVERDETQDCRGVVRGGCWASSAQELRCASRRDWYKTEGARHIGFRVARDGPKFG
jgi:formylglycine-generating enzyme required for sulfatase activity